MQLTTGNGTLTAASYTYDAMSRLASVGSAGFQPAVTASYSRVSGSSLLATTTTGNLTTTRTYDNLNRLTSIGNAGITPTISYSYIYNDHDQRSKATLADGSYWLYTYDQYGQVISGKKYDASNAEIPNQQFGYEFDSIGNRTKSSMGIPARDSIYSSSSLTQYTQRTVPGTIDIAGQANLNAQVTIQRMPLGDTAAAFAKLTGRTNKYFSKDFTFDNSSNPVSEDFRIFAVETTLGKDTVSNQTVNVFLPKTPEIYKYDPDGNLLQTGRFNFVYDGENRPVSVTPIVPYASSKKVEFAYDYMGRRVEKKIYSWVSNDWQLSKTEKFVYDGNVMIAVFDASNTLKESYLYGEDISGSHQATGGIGGLLAVKDSSGTYLPCYDSNGNITAYVNSADGKVAAEIEYDPFGRQIVKAGPKADHFRMRFSTLPFDPEMNSTRYLHRDLDHETGRWLGRDPSEDDGGNNLYAFVSNNPISKYDVLGMWNSDVHKTMTGQWAFTLFPYVASNYIATADDAVDGGFWGTGRGWAPFIGTQSYHFNRPWSESGEDSRLKFSSTHLNQAKESCSDGKFGLFSKLINDVPEQAAEQLGASLHPLQDYYAHGDHGKLSSGELIVPHNFWSPQRISWNDRNPAGYPDNPELDAIGGDKFGRPAGKAMKEVLTVGGWQDYSLYGPGSKRITATKRKTIEELKVFKLHLMNQKKCCKCLDYFGILK